MSIILRPNEELIKASRRHVVFFIPAFFPWPILIVFVYLVRYIFDLNFSGYWFETLICVILLVALVILYKYYIWHSNALIITNQRVVENKQHGFFSKTVTELLFRDIREISYDKNGMNASIYDYGDLKMRTAADNEIIIEKISKPDEIVELINRVRQGNKISNDDGDLIDVQ